MKKTIITIALTLCTVFVLSACGLDVVGKIAVTSFEKIQEKAQAVKEGNQTKITSPTGNIFEYGPDGMAMNLPLAPFVTAGLNINKLPSYMTVENNMLVIWQDYKADNFKSFVEKYRDKVGYHEALDHYGIDMGNGNKFEWAKDMDKNDKDVVFVLNPDPLKDAGVDVENVQGFAYAEVEVTKGEFMWRLLGPFDLNNEKAASATVTPTPVATSVRPPAPSAASEKPAKTTAEADGIVINKSEITSQAKFISYTVDGINMEVFAVKASDGKIKTAFNTCQVCFDSGRGYYIQQGDVFVCQNCGNQFKTSDIEKIKGGCNPVPITQDFKTEDGSTVKIPASTLSSAKELFLDWKR